MGDNSGARSSNQSAAEDDRNAAAEAALNTALEAAEATKDASVTVTQEVSYPVKEIYYKVADAFRDYFFPAEARRKGAACEKVVPTFYYDNTLQPGSAPG